MKNILKGILKSAGVELKKIDQNNYRYEILYDKYKEFTMVPKPFFILNLDLCNQYKHIQGDYVECGVWRGGMSAAISEVLGGEHQLHLFDSFEGLPAAKEIDGKEALEWQASKESPDYYDNCAADESYALKALAKADCINYKIYKGWFESTLATYPQNSIAILRLDGDWYDSIRVCLDHLFQYVSPGGIIILDDYYSWDGCAKAVHDYLSITKNSSRLHEWKGKLPYIIKKDG
jgi:hypothetical protein